MRRPSLVTSVTVSKFGAIHSDGVRISRLSADRDRLTPMRDSSGPIRPPTPDTRWQELHCWEKSRWPCSTFPTGASGAATVLRFRRYATICRMSLSAMSSLCLGMSVPGTPLRMVSNSRSSVAPPPMNATRSGPR